MDVPATMLAFTQITIFIFFDYTCLRLFLFLRPDRDYVLVVSLAKFDTM